MSQTTMRDDAPAGQVGQKLPCWISPLSLMSQVYWAGPTWVSFQEMEFVLGVDPHSKYTIARSSR